MVGGQCHTLEMALEEVAIIVGQPLPAAARVEVAAERRNDKRLNLGGGYAADQSGRRGLSLDRPRALDDGRGVGAAIGHLGSISLVSRASAASAFARAEREPGPSARIAKRHINWNKDPSRGPGSRLFARAPHSLGRDTRGTVTPRSRQSLP